MDKGPPPLDNRVVKRRDDSFGSAKTGKPFEATKRRPRIISSCRRALLVRLIIPPQRRDRWFKSSPATNFSAAGAWRVRVIRFSLIRQRIQVTESESIDAGNAPALHLCRCREKSAREIAVYRMQ